MISAIISFIAALFGFVPKQSEGEKLGKAEAAASNEAAVIAIQKEQIRGIETKESLDDSLRDGKF